MSSFELLVFSNKLQKNRIRIDHHHYYYCYYYYYCYCCLRIALLVVKPRLRDDRFTMPSIAASAPACGRPKAVHTIGSSFCLFNSAAITTSRRPSSNASNSGVCTSRLSKGRSKSHTQSSYYYYYYYYYYHYDYDND